MTTDLALVLDLIYKANPSEHPFASEFMAQIKTMVTKQTRKATKGLIKRVRNHRNDNDALRYYSKNYDRLIVIFQLCAKLDLDVFSEEVVQWKLKNT